jgi:hypothetical protein
MNDNEELSDSCGYKSKSYFKTKAKKSHHLSIRGCGMTEEKENIQEYYTEDQIWQTRYSDNMQIIPVNFH